MLTVIAGLLNSGDRLDGHFGGQLAMILLQLRGEDGVVAGTNPILYYNSNRYYMLFLQLFSNQKIHTIPQ